MKKILIIFLIILTSCSKNEYQEQLIGNWNNFQIDFMTDINFENDSFVSYNFFEKSIGTWKVDSTKIYFTFLNNTKSYNRKSATYNYQLSDNKDTLYIYENRSSFHKYVYLLRVKDYWKHYLKEIDLEIELPKADFELVEIDSEKKGFDIYIGFKNDNIGIKTESAYQKHDILKRLYFFPIDKSNSHYNLIIDEKVPQKVIDSVKQILSIYPKMNFFRVYNKDSANYGKYNYSNPSNDSRKDWNWYGKYD